MISDKRDANEKEIVEFWRGVGAVWIPMSRTAGFDGVLVYRGVTYTVEIKNPACRWSFTRAEAKRKAEIENAGGEYWLVCDLQDAQKLIEINLETYPYH
jgi:hypothetical protein